MSLFNHSDKKPWKDLVATPDQVLKRIEPGMSIFLGTGVGEPRTLVKRLMTSEKETLRDLELIQLVSLGDAISLEELQTHKYRLKTFFSGWVASEAITDGRVDLIPSRFSRIPHLIDSGQIPVDVAMVQITPPNEAGFCSLGVAVDVGRTAMEKASLVVGEINPRIPNTFGDTFVHVSEFDFLIESDEEPVYFGRWPRDDVIDKLAANVASLIDDGSCIAYSIGALFEALGPHLMNKRHLGVHSPFITDSLMDLIKSGAVTNRHKEIFRGKTLTSYAFGTRELMAWLHRNPMVEFQGIDKVFNPRQIGQNPNFVSLLPVRRVDLTGRVALHFGKGNVTAGPGDAMDFINGAEISRGGFTVIALPSRNRKGKPNILFSVEKHPNQLSIQDSIDMVATEYGVAFLNGRTVRERAQALIEIAHPDDRPALVERAKEEKVLYHDQIFLAESAHLYPSNVDFKHTFKGGTEVRFRAIKPSDEEAMRRLFYRFSDKSVYYRYFVPLKTMPHSKMQEYVNVDYREVMSIVGLTGEPGRGRIIAEARFVKDKREPRADVAFVVDEAYQGLGIASYIYRMLVRLAKEKGLTGFTADVLASNKGMMKVFEKGGFPIQARLEDGVYELSISF
ncbi:MAG: GNAT family N-acetyltransferase [Desulfobacterales bacterium]|nr:GNAT family N-acetyltransferase [Desulfobacterales bacterium]